jgi:hypothetical protein
MSRVVDTLGKELGAGGIWITLRADAPGGVSLGGTESIEPGETKQVPASIALQLLNTQRARRAAPPTVVPEEAPGVAPEGTPPTRKRRGT